jgi:hypothetical protein
MLKSWLCLLSSQPTLRTPRGARPSPSRSSPVVGRTAWVGYRTYREEQKHRRLTGGMMEQQQLDKLAQLSAGDEAAALALIAQTIAKGWQDFYPLDKPRPTISHATSSSTSKPGTARHHVPVVSSYGKL